MRAGDGPAYLDVYEDDLYVVGFEEPLQGLHEVLQGGEKRVEEGETPSCSPGSERQGQGDRDGKRQTNRETKREKEAEVCREKREKQRQGNKDGQEKRQRECPRANLYMTVRSTIIHNSQ